MSTAKEAPDLGHQTAGNGIHRSMRGDLRHAIHSQGPQRERAERGGASQTPEVILGWEQNVQPHYSKQTTDSLERGVVGGEGEYLLQDHNHHLGGHWVLKLPSGRPNTKMFLKTLPPPHSDSSVLVVFSLETQLQHCWDWRWQSPGWAEPGAPGDERSSYQPHPHPTPAHSHLSTSLCFLLKRVIASSGMKSALSAGVKGGPTTPSFVFRGLKRLSTSFPVIDEALFRIMTTELTLGDSEGESPRQPQAGVRRRVRLLVRGEMGHFPGTRVTTVLSSTQRHQAVHCPDG